MDDRSPNLKFDAQNKVGYYVGNAQYIVDSTIINQLFYNQIILSNSLTNYVNTIITSNVDVRLGPDPRIGGSAEIRMIADGSHTPVFDAAFIKSAGSSDYDTTVNTINKVIFYYDGTNAFYSITIL